MNIHQRVGVSFVFGRWGLKFLVIYFFLCKSRGPWVVFIIFYAYSKW